MPAGLPAPCMGKTAPPTSRVSSAAAVRAPEHRRLGSGFQQSTSKITGAFGRQISDSPQHTQFTCGVGIPLPELTQHLPHLSTCRRGSENFQRPSDSLLSDPQRRTLNLIWFLAYSHHATPRILQGDSGDCVFSDRVPAGGSVLWFLSHFRALVGTRGLGRRCATPCTRRWITSILPTATPYHSLQQRI